MLPTDATIFILGSGGFARELHDYIKNLCKPSQARFGSKLIKNEIFFVDDNNPEALSVKEYHRMMTVGSEQYSIMGAGHCDIRKNMISEIKGPLMSFVHPRAVNLGSVGKGCVIAPGAVIAPRVIVGRHVLCNYNSTIGHDSTIGDRSIICPNVSVGGTCAIGEGVYIGSNACIRENITVGNGAVIGMGATVTKNVPPGITIINVNERLK